MRQPTLNRTSRQDSQRPPLTRHAWQRMTARGIPSDAVDAALQYGRIVYTRGAAISAIGRKEVEQCRKLGVNLSAYEGVQVVCSSDGAVMTTYRNRDFRGLRTPSRKKSWR
jgi:hypothetical protein